MIEVVFTPKWFYGKDILIDIFSIVVLLLISFFMYRYYRLNKEKKYFYLGTSFVLIALSFVFKIVMNFTIYFPVTVKQNIGFLVFTYDVLKSSDVLFFYGYLLYRIFMLIGLFAFFGIYKKPSKSSTFLILYLLVISTWFSQNTYFIFHLTAFLILFMITYRLYENCKKTKHHTAVMLTLSFAIITLSQVLFIYIKLNPMLYVIAEIVQLIGYIVLLVTFIKVLSNVKKKKPYRDHS